MNAVAKHLNGWQTMDTAPKGNPMPYNSGPEIIGISIGKWGCSYNFVWWSYHKNPEKGSWKSAHGVWVPDFWMYPPAPPVIGD